MTRIHWEKEEKNELENYFAKNPHPGSTEKQMIASKLEVSIVKVNNFFKNKRQRLRRSGVAIKRVFHKDPIVRESKSRRTTRNAAKVTQSEVGQVVKNEPCDFVIKQERDDDPDYQPDESVETSVCIRAPKSPNLINDCSQPVEKASEMAPINHAKSPSFKNITTRGPIQSLFPTTPIQQARFTTSTPIIPTYLPIQSPYVRSYLEATPSCFDSNATQYFPVNVKSTKATDIAHEHEKDLDQILENNVNELDASNDTGTEDAGFEMLSEPEPEIEIKPLPNWFPFSVLYPNQSLYPSQPSYQLNMNLGYYPNQGYCPSIYQKYMPF